MAWLIKGVPIEPRFHHPFRFTGLSEDLKRKLLLGTPIGEPFPRLVGESEFKSGRLYPLLDLFPTIFRAWIVCDEFKQIAEVLEPSRNQFFPVTLVDEIEKEVPRRYHVLHVTQRQETLDLQKSYVHAHWEEVMTETGPVKRIKYWGLDPMPAPLFANKAAIAGKHLWRGDQNFWSNMFFSDELMKRVKKVKLSKLQAYPVTEE